ncbi:MAG: YceI family protein [Acidimicrobiia bacterium]|nr:YceI family protein [Acidimicrobiia bacterium]
MSSFRIVPDRSSLIIQARSSVGGINWEATGIDGAIVADIREGAVDADAPIHAKLEMAVDELRSGNALYDAELLQRIDARRYPTTTVELREVKALTTSRYRVIGDLSFHGITREVSGTVVLEATDADTLMIEGEQVFDIRDFDVPSPKILMLKILPDVRVHMLLRAERES